MNEVELWATLDALRFQYVLDIVGYVAMGYLDGGIHKNRRPNRDER